MRVAKWTRHVEKVPINLKRFRKVEVIQLPKIAKAHLRELADQAGKSMTQWLEEVIWDKWMDLEVRRKRLEREAAARKRNKTCITCGGPMTARCINCKGKYCDLDFTSHVCSAS